MLARQLAAMLPTLALLAGLQAVAAVPYDDGRNLVSGAGDPELLGLLSYARRSLGEGGGAVEAEYQTIPMLYSGGEDGLLEGVYSVSVVLCAAEQCVVCDVQCVVWHCLCC